MFIVHYYFVVLFIIYLIKEKDPNDCNIIIHYKMEEEEKNTNTNTHKYVDGIVIETTEDAAYLKYPSGKIYTFTDVLSKRYSSLIQSPIDAVETVVEHSVNFKRDILKTVLKIHIEYQSMAIDYATDYLKYNLFKASCDYNDMVTSHACLFMALNDFGSGTNTHALFNRIVDHNSTDSNINSSINNSSNNLSNSSNNLSNSV